LIRLDAPKRAFEETHHRGSRAVAEIDGRRETTPA